MRWIAIGLVLVAGCTPEGAGAPRDPGHAPETPDTSAPPEAPPQTPEETVAEDLGFIPGEIIVKLSEPVPFAELDASGLDVEGEHLTATRELLFGAVLFTLDMRRGETVASVGSRTMAAVEALRARSDVEYVHENFTMEFSRTPDDPLYASQWHYPAINLPQAWDITTGSSTTVIAVLDSGRLDHPDLSNKWHPGGWDFGDEDDNPAAVTSWHHGLHVAGILGGSTNNTRGVAGVCWNCPLLAVKVSRNGEVPPRDMNTVAKAIEWAASVDESSGRKRASVINMSLGSLNERGLDTCPRYLQEAIDFAHAAGVVLVAAAGNGYQNGPVPGRIHYPALCEHVIAVAASDENGNLASYSRRNSRINITAPGGGLNPDGQGYAGSGIDCRTAGENGAIGNPPRAGTRGAVSTWAESVAPMDLCYRYLAGTSMAAPHVAGVAALMLSLDPSLSPDQVLDKLERTARRIPTCMRECGAGLLDAHAAVQAATEIFGDGFD